MTSVAFTTATTVSPFLSFNSSAPRDDAFNEVVPHVDDHMSHDVAQLDLFDRSTELVSR
jgi:hypothetical protein